MFGLEDELLEKIARLEAKLRDYDNQFSRMSQALGGDARNSSDGTFAGFVIEKFHDLQNNPKQ